MVRYAIIEIKLMGGVDFTEEIAGHCINNLVLEHVPKSDASSRQRDAWRSCWLRIDDNKRHGSRPENR